MSTQEHNYDKLQNFNFITRLLHRTRFRNLEKLIIRASIEKKGKLNIVDVGCGHAAAYKNIKQQGIDFDYVGVDLRRDFCDIANDRFSQFENFNIICDSIENQFEKFIDADVIIGLESFEHIPEPLVVRTIEAISKVSFMYLYITVPNEVGPAIFVKNIGSALMGYQRYKEYEWRETFFASIYELDKVRTHDTGHKGFDWRWLAQTLRQNTTILKKTSSPADFIPKFISPSVGFICVKSNNDDN
jgi:SAM-dependent methyltransferase